MNIIKKKGKIGLSLNREDFQWHYFTAGGKGGQKQNKTASAVRCVHTESGADGISRDERSQWENRKRAFIRCCAHYRFKYWVDKKLYELEHEQTIEEEVEASMKEENLLIQVRDSEKGWVEVTSDQLKD